MENKRIPFDWEKYQSGEFEAVCRDGVTPIIGGYNSSAIDGNNALIYWYKNKAYTRKANGLLASGIEMDEDVFLIPKPKKFQAWVNLYSNGCSSTSTHKQLADELAEKLLQENPNQVFEPIELRPEELVSGEVYKAVGEYTFIFRYFNRRYSEIWHNKLIGLNISHESDSGFISDQSRFYHATPEEKKLLGEEQTDWKAKFEEANRLYALEAVKVANLDAKYDALADSHSRLEDYDKELEKVVDEQSKLIKRLQNELQEKESQEKVYFYWDKIRQDFFKAKDKTIAIRESDDEFEVYEAVKIGVKKSVLVNENS